MTQPIALQLYTVREQAAEDFGGTIRRIAQMGYRGVETAGFPDGVTPESARQLFDTLALEVVSAHSPLPLGDDQQKILDTMAALGTQKLVCPYLDPETYFSTIDGIKRACELLNRAAEATQKARLTLLYHNHWFEYQAVDGKLAYQVMLEHLDPAIGFEIDTYWVQVGGQDVVSVLNELGDRVNLLHIKDGNAANKDEPMLAVGAGVMDFKTIIANGKQSDWLIVELDRCASDMLDAVEQSYAYLTGEGLAEGKTQ